MKTENQSGRSREPSPNGQSVNPLVSPQRRHAPPERHPVPSRLYEVDRNGVYRVSSELDDIRISDPDASQMPSEQIEHLASTPDAFEQVTKLAESVVDESRAGLLAAIDHDEGYLEFQASKLGQERERIEAEFLAMPYDTKERDPSVGWKSMGKIERVGLIAAMVFLLLMATWTGASDLSLVYDNLSIAFPVESGEIDFAALYASDGNADAIDAPEDTPLYRDPNAYKSIAIFSVLFALFKWLNVMKLAPLNNFRSMPAGVIPKLRWLFTPLGLIFTIQVTLLVSAIAFNVRIGFELDRTASDINVEPPVSSATTYSLMAIALAFAAYAFLYWIAQIFERICGVRTLPNPMKLVMDERIEQRDRQLDSVMSVLSCFKGLRGDHSASKNRFVAECLSVLAGLQDKQRRAAELAEAAAQQAAASSRLQSLAPSNN